MEPFSDFPFRFGGKKKAEARDGFGSLSIGVMDVD